jgi:hypothetical protein
MGKRIFWIFIASVVLSTAAVIFYIQSESFATIVKKEIQKTVSRDLGIELNFDRVRIGILPPSISLLKVDLKVKSKSNALDLSTDTVFRAERLGFSFRMIQSFSRGIAVNKVFLTDGELELLVPKSKNNSSQEKLSDLLHKPIQIQVGEKFLISIRQIEVRNTKTKISWRNGDSIDSIGVEKVSYLALTPSFESANLVSNFEGVEVKLKNLNEKFSTFKLNADIGKNRVDISTIDLQRKDAVLHGAGELAGSIDDLEQMQSNLQVILRSPLRELSDFDFTIKGIEGDLKGDFEVSGKLQAPEAKGTLTLENFKYRTWQLDSISLNASYGSNGDLRIKSLEAKRERGKIFLRNPLVMKLPLQSQKIDLSLGLENANFQSFAGDLKEDLNNLLMELEGSLDAKLDLVVIGRKFSFGDIEIKPKALVRNLELNNQVFGKSRQYKTIFKVNPIQVTGNLSIRDGGLIVNNAELKLDSGIVNVEGSVTKQKGFDLRGNTDFVDLGKEVGSISGITLFGSGAASIYVYGKGDAVKIDFDVKQKNARFINFDFGSIDGKITYDDQKSYIYLENIKGEKGVSKYSASGSIDIGEGDAIDLDVEFSESDPNDLFALFAYQIRDISWIPHGMTGSLKGKVKVGGGYSKDIYSLAIGGKIFGDNISYMGEVIQEADVDFQLKDALLSAKINKARKYETPIFGSISYKLTGEIDYFLETAKGKLRSIDWFSNSGLPIDGLFQLKSRGKGKWETLESKSTFNIINAYVRTKSLPEISIEHETTSDRSRFIANIGSNASIQSVWGQSEKFESNAQLKFSRTNLDFLLCALSKRNCNDPSLGFTISGDSKFFWKGKGWNKLSGRGEITDLTLARTGFLLKNADPVEITADNGNLSVAKMVLVGENSKLNFKLSGAVDGSNLENTMAGDVSLRLLEFVTPLVEEARGILGINLSLSGNTANAKFKGLLNWQDGFIRSGGVDAPVDNFSGQIRFNENKVTLDGINGQIGGGSVQARGGMDLYLNRAPKFDIELNLANNRLKFFPVNYAEILDAKIGFTGEKAPYLLSGSARAKRVMMRNNFSLSGGAKGAKNARYLPENIGGSKSFYEIRIKTIAESGVIVQNNLLDAEFKGEVTLLNTFEFPQVVARAELVKGKLLFRNTPFTLDHAYIRAPNPEVFNPQFSIGGIANVDNYRISIFASGTIEKPKISLSSYPSIPQEDIVSLLAFGYRGEDARKVNPSDTSAITYSEVGSILLEQLQINQNLSSKGLKVSVTPALNETEASIIRPNSTQTASPKVNVKTQILKNLDASFGGTVGSAQGQSLDARLEYRLSRKATISAIYEQTPDLDLNDIKSSYGADLKFRWGFK